MLHIDHIMLHPMQPRLICNSKFSCFTTAQQNWSNTTFYNIYKYIYIYIYIYIHIYIYTYYVDICITYYIFNIYII